MACSTWIFAWRRSWYVKKIGNVGPNRFATLNFVLFCSTLNRAGVGKTYTLAFTVAENLAAKIKKNRGNEEIRKTGRTVDVGKDKFLKVLWLTSSPQHFPKMLKAMRLMDKRLSKFNQDDVKIYIFDGDSSEKSDNDLDTDKHTVVLMTYTTLIQSGDCGRKTKRSRFNQILNWMGCPKEFTGLVSKVK